MAENIETAAEVLSGAEIDAIGEILNISMGSAATAISTMLDKQVLITTPQVEVQVFHDVSYAALEPAIMVKIEYVEGISGKNVMVFRQSDMQIILNLLMGSDDPASEEFVFDEMSMSAACEVMNQMMGASATALSSFLGKSINISTPVAVVMDDQNTFEGSMEVDEKSSIVSISFTIDIVGVMKSEFISVMTIDLAKELVGQMLESNGMGEEEAQPGVPVQDGSASVAPQQPAAATPQATNPPPQMAAPSMPPQQQAMPPQMQMPPMPGMEEQYPPQQMSPEQWAAQYPQMPGGQQYPYPPYGYPPYGYPPYGYPMQESHSPSIIKQTDTVKVQTPKFPSFAGQQPVFSVPISSNMEMMMDVPLNVAVEIGKTKKKIKDIMDFAQGTVIELEKQAGAPVDIIVNGRFIARGDVVVVGDNFGVRITEIVGTKDLVDSLDSENN